MQYQDCYNDSIVLIHETIEQTYERCCKLWDSMGYMENTADRQEIKEKMLGDAVNVVTMTMNQFYEKLESVRNETIIYQ